MNQRRRMITFGLIILGLALVLAMWIAHRRRKVEEHAVPAWLDPQQPPDTVAADMMILSPAESWAANRCAPMVASCRGRTAGARIRRTYPESLAASHSSFIRAGFSIGGGI